MKMAKEMVSIPAKLDNALSKEALDRIAVEDIIPTEAQISKILPTLRQSRSSAVCPRCKSFKHSGKCITVKIYRR